MDQRSGQLLVAVWVSVFVCFTDASCEDGGVKVKEIYPHHGSLAGQTRITIPGCGFAKSQFNFEEDVGNKVNLVRGSQSYGCEVHKDATTTKQIVCYSPPLPEGGYQVRVMVNGKPVLVEEHCRAAFPNDYRCSFKAREDNTPIIETVTPQSGQPGTIVEFCGTIFTDLLDSTNATATNKRTERIRRAYIGGNVCDLKPDPSKNEVYGVWLEGEESDKGCIRCKITGTYVASTNGSFIVEGPFGRSMARNKDGTRNVYRISAMNKKYMFQTYAVVDGVTPHIGGTTGGTLVTINGKFFDDTDAPVKAQIDGADCKVVSVDDDKIICEAPKSQPARSGNVYPGSRGLTMEIWNGTSYKYAEADKVLDLTPDVGDYKSLPHDETYYHMALGLDDASLRFTAFFIPPSSGSYSFRLKAYSAAGLLLSTDDNPANKVKIASCSTHCGASWDSLDTQLSSPVSLEGGKSYYLEAYASNRKAAMNLQVGVERDQTVFVASQTKAARNEIQKVAISSSMLYETQRLTLNNWKTQSKVSEIQTVTVTSPAGTIANYRLCLDKVCTAPIKLDATPIEFKNILQRHPSITPDKTAIKRETVANGFKYTITYGSDKGDFPNLEYEVEPANADVTIQVAEQTQGKSSLQTFGLEFDGIPSIPISSTATDKELRDGILSMIGYKCPSSITEGGVFYAGFEEESEASTWGLPVKNVESFCGRTSLKNPTHLFQSSEEYNEINLEENPWLCFAYKGQFNLKLSFSFVENGATFYKERSISPPVQSGSGWHYNCLDMKEEVMEILKKHYPNNKDAALLSIHVSPKSHLDFYVDNIYIGAKETTVPAEGVYKERMSAARPRDYIIEDVEVTKVDNYVYDITFYVFNCGNNLPLLGARYTSVINKVSKDVVQSHHANWPAGASIKVERTVAGSKGVTGSYSLTWGSETVADIPADVEADGLVGAIQAHTSLGKVRVVRSGKCSGYTWDIEFVECGGAKPLPTVTKKLNGRSLKIEAVSVQKGGLFSSILSGDMLKPLYKKPQVSVAINNIPSLCTGDCSYEWKSSHTPAVSSVSPSSGSSFEKTVLTISGSNLEAVTGNEDQSTVIIGGAECKIKSHTNSEITCNVGKGPIGTYNVEIYIQGKGKPSGTDSEFTNNAAITGLNPVTGAPGGGINMTVNGYGFDGHSTVTVGGETCPVAKFTGTSIVCTVPSKVNGASDSAPVVVLHPKGNLDSPTSYIYDNSLTPTITQLSFTELPVTGEEDLTLIGSNLGKNQPKSAKVLIGSTEVYIKSWSTDKVVVALPPHVAGGFPVTVALGSIGYADTSALLVPHLTYQLKVTSVFPKQGSLYGGTKLTIKGKGFGTDKTTVEVAVSNYATNVTCEINDITDMQILCDLSNGGTIHVVDNFGQHPDYGTGYAWSPAYNKVKVGDYVNWRWAVPDGVKDITYAVQQTATAGGSLYEGGFTSGARSARGSFSYQFSQVGTYYYMSGTVDAQENINMMGRIEVVDVTAHSEVINVKRNGYEAVQDTKSGASKPSDSSSCVPVLSKIPQCSESQIDATDKSKFSFNFLKCYSPTVSKISPNKGVDTSTITITGTGFESKTCRNKVMVGDSECTVSSSTATEINCSVDHGDKLMAGVLHKVSVCIWNRGCAIVEPMTPEARSFKLIPKIESISPIQGSRVGGTMLTITGAGFSGEAKYTEITISDKVCKIKKFSYTEIICETADSGNIKKARPVILQLHTYEETLTAECPNGCDFFYANAATPKVTSISPNTISGATKMTITGTNFGSTLEDVKLVIADEEYTISSVTPTEITLNVDGLPYGTHLPQIYINGVGRAKTQVTIESERVMTSISPTSGGVNGGVKMTITGNGFSEEVRVFIAKVEATVLSFTSIQMVVVTPPLTAGGRNVVPQAKNSLDWPSLNYIVKQELTPVVTNSAVSGNTLTLTGSVFSSVPADNDVRVGGQDCVVSSASETQLQCTIPALSAGTFPVSLNVKNKGDATISATVHIDVVATSISPASGSFGGGQMVTITGSGFNPDKTTVKVCENICQLQGDSNSATSLVCESPANSGSGSVKCDVEVQVNGETDTITSAYTYDSSLTADISDVKPRRAGTGGGTRVTITGTGFSSKNSQIKVSIAGIGCPVKKATTEKIICETEPSHQTAVAKIRVDVKDNGIAKQDKADFWYIDVWSSPWTWGGGRPPVAGDMVEIKKGQTILLDVDTPVLVMLLIRGGHLMFDDERDIHLQAENILITDGGHFQIGSEEEPYTHQAEITMYGELRSLELPIYGAKAIAVREGTLDMHGSPTPVTWTQLKATAKAGDTVVKLNVPVNWKVGDRVVLPSTGNRHSQDQNEDATIAAISADQMTLTLKDPLKHTHKVEVVTVNGGEITMSGEVGLLSHNIKVRGSNNVAWNVKIEACPEGFDTGEFATQTCFQGRHGEEMGSNEFGATIMLHAPRKDEGLVSIHLEYVELSYVGQAFRLGRYPIHIHLNGDMSGSYIRGVSVTESFNRMVNIHGSHNMLVEHCVGYDILGGAMFLEDGNEVGNIFQYNMLAFVRASSSLLNDDVTPAAFWVTNPNNIVRHNVAAGGTHFGFWYRIHEHPDGPSYDPDICPQKAPLGEFYNNTAHSLGWFGLWIFRTYTPTTDGKCSSTDWAPAVFEKLFAWDCEKGAEWVQVGLMQFKDFILVNNEKAGIEAKLQNTDPDYRFDLEKGPLIKDPLIVAYTSSKAEDYCTHGGIVLPYGVGLSVDGAVFANFDRDACVALHGTTVAGVCEDYCGAYSYGFSRLKFDNSPRRGRFRWQHEMTLMDEDGSLTDSKPGSLVMATTPAMPSTCKQDNNFSFGVPASLCPSGMKTIRFAFNKPNPPSVLGKDAIMTNDDGAMLAHFGKKRSTNPMGWVFDVESKRRYNLAFANSEALTNLSYSGVFQGIEDGDWVIICHKLLSKPDMFELVPGQPLPLSPYELSYANNENGDWYYYDDTQEICYLISSKDQPGSSSRKKRSVKKPIKDRYVAVHAYTCVKGVSCITPVDVNTLALATSRPEDAEMWSDASAWTKLGFTGIPKANDDVTIPKGTWMVLDENPKSLRYLTIEGTLEVDPDSKNVFTLSAEVILIKGGRLIAGFEDERFAGDLTLELRGEVSTNSFQYDAGTIGPPIGIKTIAVFGALELRGLDLEVKWTKLSKTAQVGDSSITVETAVDWEVGQELVIAPTSYNAWQTETFKIKSISGDKKTLTVDGTLQHPHLGETYNVPGKSGETYTLAAHVGLLSRNIKIVGASYPNMMTESLGARVICGNLKDTKLEYNGFCHLDSVEFYRTGQYGFNSVDDPRYSVTYQNLGQVNEKFPSVVKGCTFHHGFWAAVAVIGTEELSITDNVIYHTVGGAIVIRDAIDSVNIERNLVVLMVSHGTYQGRLEKKIRYDGSIDVLNAANAVVRNNVVSGSESTGFNLNRRECLDASLDEKDPWYGNEVYSSYIGVDLFDIDKSIKCTYAGYFTIWRCSDYGMYFNTWADVKVTSVTLVDNQVGFLAIVVGPNSVFHRSKDHTVTVKNSMVVGTSPDFDCTLDKVNKNDNNYKMSGPSRPWSGRAVKGGRVGLSMSTFTASTNKAPKMKLNGIEYYQSIRGQTIFNNVHFASFEENKCGLHDVAITPVIHNEDFIHPLKLTGITLGDVDRDHMFFLQRPDISMVSPQNCVDMDCDSKKKIVIEDTDGSMLGKPGFVVSQSEFEWDGDKQRGLGDYRIPKLALTDSEGNLLSANDVYPNKGIYRTDKCKFVSEWQAYECYDTDYRVLVIESLDPDTETRRLSPVAVIVDDFIDLVNGPQDHGWCSGYTCQKRLSLFHSVVPLGKTVKVFMTSVCPQSTRLRLLNSHFKEGVVVGIYYTKPQRLDIYMKKNYIVPINAALDENGQISYTEPGFEGQFMPKPSSPSGTNYFDAKSNMIYVTLKGSDTIDIKISPIIKFKLTMEPMTADEFFGENLINHLAAFLGIDPSKIKIVNIVKEEQPSRRKRDIWESLLLFRSRRATKEVFTEEVEEEPVSGLIQNEIDQSNNTNATNEYIEKSREELNAVAGNLTLAIQSGNLGPQLGIKIVMAAIEDPLPPASDSQWAEKVEEELAVATVGNEVEILLPDHMEILGTPDVTTAGVAFTFPPVIRMVDASGKVVPLLGTTTNPWQIRASIQSGTGTAGTTLRGKKVLSFVQGYANFTNLAISEPGEGYMIDFTIVSPDTTSVVAISAGPFTVSDASVVPRTGEQPSEVEEDHEFNVIVKLADAVTGKDIVDTVMKLPKMEKSTAQLSLPAQEPGLMSTLAPAMSSPVLAHALPLQASLMNSPSGIFQDWQKRDKHHDEYQPPTLDGSLQRTGNSQSFLRPLRNAG